MAEIRRSKKIQRLSTELRDACTERGVHLLAGEADEIVAERIAAMAQTLGVTTQTVLNRYVLEDFIPTLTEVLVNAEAQNRSAVDSVEPVTLDVAEAGRVLASLGMTLKLAVEAMETGRDRTSALGITTDIADAVVGIGVAVHNRDQAQPVMVAGPTLVYTRKVLNQGIEFLRDGSWKCPCRDRHVRGIACITQLGLERDLNLVGGWADRQDEPPASKR
jgi:hypothetical protein